MIDELGGYYRRMAWRISGITDSADADTLVAMRLAEQSRPVTSSSIKVSSHWYNVTGKAKAPNEMTAGKMLVIQDWRAREAALASDSRDQWTTFQVVGVEIQNGRTVNIVPAGARDTFDRRLAQMLRDQEEGE